MELLQHMIDSGDIKPIIIRQDNILQCILQFKNNIALYWINKCGIITGMEYSIKYNGLILFTVSFSSHSVGGEGHAVRPEHCD